MRIERDFIPSDVKVNPPDPERSPPPPRAPAPLRSPPTCGETAHFASPHERKRWLYQRYIKDYLRCVDAIDEGVGLLLDYLDDDGIADDTIIVYTSDQGFFLGDHGWYDKRFMYEESLRMPFIVRYPRAVQPGTVNGDMILNVDFAETFLDFAGVTIADDMQGRSFRPLLEGTTPGRLARRHVLPILDARLSSQHVGALRGAHAYPQADLLLRRSAGRYPAAAGAREEPEWELFDLQRDPSEMHSVFGHPALRRSDRRTDRSPARPAGRRRRPAARAGLASRTKRLSRPLSAQTANAAIRQTARAARAARLRWHAGGAAV